MKKMMKSKTGYNKKPQRRKVYPCKEYRPYANSETGELLYLLRSIPARKGVKKLYKRTIGKPVPEIKVKDLFISCGPIFTIKEPLEERRLKRKKQGKLF